MNELTDRRGRAILSIVETELGQVIRVARLRQKMTLKGLGAESGVHWRSIYAIEVGESRRPSEDKLRALADVLGLPYGGLALAAYGVNGMVPSAPTRGGVPNEAVGASEGGVS